MDIRSLAVASLTFFLLVMAAAGAEDVKIMGLMDTNAARFDPKHYNPDAWAKLACRAGARYMVMTARHHDGFSLFDSPSSYRRFDSVHGFSPAMKPTQKRRRFIESARAAPPRLLLQLA